MVTTARMGWMRPSVPAVLYGVTILVLAGSLVLTKGSAGLQITALLYVAAMVLALRHPTVAVFVTVLTMLVQLTLLGLYLTSAWVDLRFLAMPVIVGLAGRALPVWRADRTALRQKTGSSPRTERLAVALQWALPVTALLGLLSLFWSINRTATMNRTSALLAAAVFCLAAVRTMSIERITWVLAAIGWVTIVASVAMFAVDPGLAVQQGRLRGVFENANGLADFLVVLAPIILIRLRQFRWLAALVLFSLCATTGSRAGCAALAFEFLVFLIADRAAVTRVIVLVSAGGIGLWLVLTALQMGTFTDTTVHLLRNNNSRAQVWAQAMWYFDAHPLLGIGMGAAPSRSFGGILQESLATTGLVGTAIAGCFVIALLVSGFRSSSMFTALVAGGLINVLFEPWLFSGGSMFCVVFWLIVCHPDSMAYRGRRSQGLSRGGGSVGAHRGPSREQVDPVGESGPTGKWQRAVASAGGSDPRSYRAAETARTAVSSSTISA